MAHGCRQRLKRLSAQQKAVEGSRVVGRGGLGVFIYISHLEGACSYRADLCIDSGVKQMKRGSGRVQYHLCTCNRLGLTHVNGPASTEWVEPDGSTAIALRGWGCNAVWHSRGQARGEAATAAALRWAQGCRASLIAHSSGHSTTRAAPNTDSSRHQWVAEAAPIGF